MPHLKPGATIIDTDSSRLTLHPMRFLNYPQTKACIVAFAKWLAEGQEYLQARHTGKTRWRRDHSENPMQTTQWANLGGFGNETRVGGPASPQNWVLCTSFLRRRNQATQLDRSTVPPAGRDNLHAYIGSEADGPSWCRFSVVVTTAIKGVSNAGRAPRSTPRGGTDGMFHMRNRNKKENWSGDVDSNTLPFFANSSCGSIQPMFHAWDAFYFSYAYIRALP